MSTTWAQIIDLVLRDSGVAASGQTPSAQMQNDAKTRMNFLLSQWKRRRWLVYHLVDVAFPCDGSLFYTLGAGQQFNVPRTDQIESAFVRQTNVTAPNGQVDYPLRIIPSYEDYSTITLKNMQAGPAYFLFYDSGYPVGRLYLWPLSPSGYSLHVQIKAELDSIVNLTDEVILPPEYHMALLYNAMQMTRAAFFLPADPMIDKYAKASLATLRASNVQIPTMSVDPAVLPYRAGGYNIFSDGWSPAGR